MGILYPCIWIFEIIEQKIEAIWSIHEESKSMQNNVTSLEKSR